MSFRPHPSSWIVVLSLTFNTAVLALPKVPVSVVPLSQSSDQETVRTLTEKYGQAIAAGDLEALRQLWNPQSRKHISPPFPTTELK
jgi:DNA-binding transcriptional regulator YbjK